VQTSSNQHPPKKASSLHYPYYHDSLLNLPRFRAGATTFVQHDTHVGIPNTAELSDPLSTLQAQRKGNGRERRGKGLKAPNRLNRKENTSAKGQGDSTLQCKKNN